VVKDAVGNRNGDESSGVVVRWPTAKWHWRRVPNELPCLSVCLSWPSSSSSVRQSAAAEALWQMHDSCAFLTNGLVAHPSCSRVTANHASFVNASHKIHITISLDTSTE